MTEASEGRAQDSHDVRANPCCSASSAKVAWDESIYSCFNFAVGKLVQWLLHSARFRTASITQNGSTIFVKFLPFKFQATYR